MGTKWKSSLAIMFICTTLFISGLIGAVLLADSGYYYAHKNYFHTSEFKYDEVERFIHYLKLFEINELTLEGAKEKITVTPDEIEEHRYRYGDLDFQIQSITEQYAPLIQHANENNDKALAAAHEKDRDQKIEDIRKNFESDEHVEEKIVKEKEKLLEDFFKEIEAYRPEYERLKDNFQYYFKDEATGKVITNLGEGASIDKLKEENMLFVRELPITDGVTVEYEIPGLEDVLQMMGPMDNYEGLIGVPKTLSSSSSFMHFYENYQKEQIVYWSVVAVAIIGLLLSLIIFNRAKKSREAIDNWQVHYKKVPLDLRVLLLGASAIAPLVTYVVFGPGYTSFIRIESIIAFVIAILLISFFITIALIQAVLLLKSVKDWENFRREWHESYTLKGFIFFKKLAMKFLEKLKDAFLDQTTGTQIILIFGLVFILGMGAITVFMHPILLVLYFLVLGGIGIPFAFTILNKIGEFNRIVAYTDEIAAGKLNNDLKLSGNTVLVKLAENINLLKQGVKTSQSEQAKSERLKTELITNVSHDLRTPLTSIITYTELLKKQGKNDEDSKAYLEIIDRKSKRLKVLIDDLFEVSKMASRNIELKKDKVDLVQLLHQALGEYDDMIKESSLEFRISHDDPPINAIVDGQKMWRVFDNLIGNILKYSLEYSRVYINLRTNQDTAVITFKNISKYELKDNTDELFERFKRGDTSRHTEGSGLGLAIVQSIVELHNGNLKIETDGDLFKVTVNLQLEG